MSTKTATATVTPQRSLTPTPLALEAQDAIIRGGDASSSSTGTFPVNLRVVQGNETQPRVFVVQRKLIQTTEWNYEENPDTASYIAGLTVRPILGIPWSAANAALFERMAPGSSFVLQMNTGASIRFDFAARYVVNRADTSWFRQVGPGLVLVLIGERDPETQEPTPNRIVVTASYSPDQELNRSGGVVGVALPKVDTPTPTLTATPAQRVDVQLVAVTSTVGRVSIKLRVYNGRFAKTTIDSRSISIVYGFVDRPVGPEIAAEVQPFDLEPGQAADLTVDFAWHGEPFAMLNVLRDYRFAIAFREGNW